MADAPMYYISILNALLPIHHTFFQHYDIIKVLSFFSYPPGIFLHLFSRYHDLM